MKPFVKTWKPRPAQERPRFPQGLYYDPAFISPKSREEILRWLGTIRPLWEERYSPNNPPPPGQVQRSLLRPVYWLGNWQFACLNYYHPPKGTFHRCVRAEPFPPVFVRLISKVETLTRRMFRGADLPLGWHLNTCLVNLYGSRLEGDRRIDTARVGEHKDFEPGPVASISLGERAMFQFVASRSLGQRDGVVFQQWLEDGSLQIFGGEKWKQRLFHRVQRVDKKLGARFSLDVENFETRRINFTFRYVPDVHITPYAQLPKGAAEDVRAYMERLADHASFFRRELERAGRGGKQRAEQ